MYYIIAGNRLNVVPDLNKGISSIAYNHLNLPKLITKGDSTIQYVYDATGNKLQKKVGTSGTMVKTTDYVGSLVYEGTTDKFLHTEEGRVVLKENGQEKEEYQYHLKDHLGNVRVTFTTADREELTSMYLLTMEPEFATLEGETFGNLETRQVDKIYNKTVGGKASAKLNAIGGKAIGPSMSLEVMPGDTVKMTVHAKYDQKATTKDAVTGIAAIVASAFTPEDATPEMSQLISQAMLKPLGASQVALFAKDNTIPKAYLNYLFFDKRMKYISGGFQQISEAAHGKFEEITLDFAPEEEGYLMVYVANQTNEPLDVFFDQMAVEHTSGPIIRVDDYYPFGMAFNTGTLAGALTNKYLYNGKELQNELGLEWHDYGARMYDAQLGRWHVVDALADDPIQIDKSPYAYAWNNPVNLIDPDGNCPTWLIPIIAKTYAKYSSIVKSAQAPAQRLISGQSGNIPSHVDMSQTTRTIIKTGSTANDMLQVADAGKELAKQAALDVGEVMDKGGEMLSDAGIVAAPFTEGTSLVLVPVGETISISGKGVKLLVHAGDRDYGSAASEGINLTVSIATNSLTSAAVNQSKKVGSITNATQETTTEAVLGTVGSLVNKVTSIFTNSLKDEEDK